MQRLKHSTSSDEKKRELNAQEIRDAHRVYLDMAENYLARAELTRQQSPSNCLVTVILRQELERFTTHARRQINQIERRVIQGENIPHEQKCFSIFEPHTEWISKGKAGRHTG